MILLKHEGLVFVCQILRVSFTWSSMASKRTLEKHEMFTWVIIIIRSYWIVPCIMTTLSHMKLAKWLGRRGVLTGVQITKYLSTLSNLRALRTIVGREFYLFRPKFLHRHLPLCLQALCWSINHASSIKLLNKTADNPSPSAFGIWGRKEGGLKPHVWREVSWFVGL